MKRRLAAILLALTLILGMSVTVLADPSELVPIPPAPTYIPITICLSVDQSTPCDCDYQYYSATISMVDVEE